jgi:exopolysaccharide biosynthesis polyprenyl glycosylphosphotransferase
MTLPPRPPQSGMLKESVGAVGGPAPALEQNGHRRAHDGRHGPASRWRALASRRLQSPRRRRSTPGIRFQLWLFRITDPVVVVSMLLGGFLATNIGRTGPSVGEFLQLRLTIKNLLLITGMAVAWRVLGFAAGLYDWEATRTRGREALRVVITCTVLSAVALVFPAMSVTGAFRYSAVLYFWIGSTVGILLLRSVVRAVTPRLESRTVADALIVGTGPRGQRLFEELRSTGTAEYNVIGFIDTADFSPPAHGGNLITGLPHELEGILMRHAVDEVLIALPIKSQYAQIQQVIETCHRVGVRARYFADLFEMAWSASHVDDDRVSMISAPKAPEGWRQVAKRTIDLVGASVGLVVLSPVLLMAALAIKWTSPGPVLFRQQRYGLNRRLFKMYKLRTMTVDADARQAELEALNEATGPVFKIRQDPRVTRVGAWLRRTSIDELPQLFNVLRGEMSLVGPRPLPVRDVHRFAEGALMRRFSVRPGCTCLWQISGRSELTFDDWIRLDLEYIDEWSLRLDLLVLLKTLPAVLKGTGAS